MTTANDRYDGLCDVIAEWLDRHKELTKAKVKFEGVNTPAAARHEYLYDAGLYGGERNGKALYDYFYWVRDRVWPTLPVTTAGKPSKATLAFDARVRAGQFELLREWVLVFDPRSRDLYADQDRANVLMAVAMAAQRIADEGTPELSAA
jgi:hypothetical protein